MKSIRNIQKAGSFLMILLILLSCSSSSIKQEDLIPLDALHLEVAQPQITSTKSANTIKIALLLDTSSSMSGLIEQAKSQLWKIVNQLSLAKKGDDYASLLISLYEYGNDGLEQSEGYVRQIIGLTNDLDEISKELFALTTNGGEEYCGEVIRKSLTQLDWQEETAGLQVIIIAGNESFDQGTTSYIESCRDALESDIIINTIYCGSKEEGIDRLWKKGADLAEGFYGSIDMNQSTIYIETPYDDEIQALNSKLNATYLAYGSERDYKLMNQQAQDANASYYSKSNEVERTISKTNSVYSNEKWDLVDAKKKGVLDWTTIKPEELPVEMRHMNEAEKNAYVNKMEEERKTIQNKIAELNIQRLDFIAQRESEFGEGNQGFDKVILEAIKQQAILKHFSFGS